MCGILGIVADPGMPVGIDRRSLISMRDTMEQRGPDAAACFLQEHVAFAHRRLAIRDRTGGAQPWLSPDEECVLVYNGEIYNDVELRSELIGLGYQFRSRSDTEVVMAAYLQWGPQCVSRLRGMFAFGIYDFRDDSLLLARDRMGIKPLFLTEVDGRLIFASSIAALLCHPQIRKAPHLPAISHYLTTFRLTLGRETLYQGIWQLLPGEMLIRRSQHVSVQRYWDYPDEDPAINYDAALDELETGLRKAVGCRLASDVPVGMFLSGGVDSNTIAALVRESTSKPLVGCCGGDVDDLGGDFNYARRCAEHVGFDYAAVRVSADDYLERWRWLAGQYATPVSTPSDVIIYELAREMRRQSVGVVLGGEGADELLCGYAVQHWAGHDFDRYRQLQGNRWKGTPAAAEIFRTSLRRQYGRDCFHSPVDHYFALNSLIPTAVKPALLQPWAWRQADEDRRMTAFYTSQFDELEGRTTADKHTVLLHRINLESLLSRLDSATMLAGLEARVPFTDHLLVEKMFRVPSRFKIDVAHDEQAPYLCSGELHSRGTLRSKRVLRSVASRLMPSELAMRPKASFPTPVQRWLSGPWQTWVRDTLLESPFGRELFQPAALQDLADNIPRAGMWLWPVLNVLIWGDRQFAAN
jgi:asparagine synthase (glutamine-hydrolysing)